MSKYQPTINENLAQIIKNNFSKIRPTIPNVENNIMGKIIDDTNKLVSTIYEKGPIESNALQESTNIVEQIIDATTNIGSELTGQGTGQGTGQEPIFDYSKVINKYKNMLDNIRTRRNILRSILETTTTLINNLLGQKDDVDEFMSNGKGEADENGNAENGNAENGNGEGPGEEKTDEENNGEGEENTDEEKNGEGEGEGDTIALNSGETIIKTTIKENNKNSKAVTPNPLIESLKIEKSIIKNKIL